MGGLTFKRTELKIIVIEKLGLTVKWGNVEIPLWRLDGNDRNMWKKSGTETNAINVNV